MAKSDILAAIKDLQTSLDIQFQATTKLFQQFTTCVDTHFIQLSSSFPSQPTPPPPTLSFHSPPLFFSPPAPSAAAAIPSSHPYSLQSQTPTPPSTSALRRVPPFPQPLAAPLLLPKSTDIPPPKQPPPPMLHPSPPPVLPPSLSPPKPPPPTDPPLNFIDISHLFRSLPIPPLIPKSPLAISVEIRCADLHTTHRSSEFSYTASSSRSTGHTQINPPQNSVPQAQIPTCSLPQSSPAVLPTPHSTQLPPQKWSNIHRCRSQFLLLLNNDEEEDSGDPEPPDLALEDKVTVGDISIIHTLTGSNTIDNRVLIDKEIPSFRIFAGNGDFLIGTRLCTDVLLRTQGHTLSMDSHIVAVERPSVVLSIQWLQRLGPVYAKEEMKFGFNSTRVQLCGEPPPETSLICFNQLQTMANLEKRKHFLGIYIWPTSAEPNLYLVLRPNLSGPNSAISATPSPSALPHLSTILLQIRFSLNRFRRLLRLYPTTHIFLHFLHYQETVLMFSCAVNRRRRPPYHDTTALVFCFCLILCRFSAETFVEQLVSKVSSISIG